MYRFFLFYVTISIKLRIINITKTIKVMLKNTGEKINDPKHNQVVFFQPWEGKTDKRKKPYPVIINSGYFLDPTFGRLSNHWYWQRLTPTGRIKPEIEYGYGNFFIAEGYSVERKVIIEK